MFFSTLITAILVIGSSAISAPPMLINKRRIAPAGLNSPIPGYALVEPIFFGTVLDKPYKIAGTVEQVYVQLEGIHGVDAIAAVVSEFQAKQVAINTTIGSESVRAREAFNAKRDKLPPPNCIPQNGGWPYPDWYPCEQDSNRATADHLRYINHGVYVPARSCASIACDYSSGVCFCNDRYEAIAPQSYYLGSYVNDIDWHCLFYGKWNDYFWSGGQLFDSDNYNVILRKNEYCSEWREAV